MDEIEFQSWKATREKGFAKYILKYGVSYCIAVLLVNTFLQVTISQYSYNTFIHESISLCIAILIVTIGRWFQREKKFKDYLKIFDSK